MRTALRPHAFFFDAGAADPLRLRLGSVTVAAAFRPRDGLGAGGGASGALAGAVGASSTRAPHTLHDPPFRHENSLLSLRQRARPILSSAGVRWMLSVSVIVSLLVDAGEMTTTILDRHWRSDGQARETVEPPTNRRLYILSRGWGTSCLSACFV